MFGYYQRYELFQPWKGRIRQDWLRIELPFVDTAPDAVYIHVRRTDYVGGNPTVQGCATSLDEFARCLQEFPDAKRLIIATDHPKDPFHRQFTRLGLPYTISGLPWDKDFLLLASCRWMIMSESTYSWWAAFLGRAERIACPVFPRSFWRYGLNLKGPASPDYVNLFVDDEPGRWLWVTENGVQA
jgi:hypothetical protein